LTGNHTLRVWAAAPDRLRVAIVGQLAETEFVTNGHEAWVYSSQRNAATHILFPAHATTPQRQETEPAITPQRLAERLLAAIEPSTAVSAGRDVEIAGRSAYQLVVQPRDPRSLVRSAVIAIDSKTGLVLRVTIYATGQSAPALQIGYTSLSLGTPARSRFSFTPPPQAKVNTVRVPAYRHEIQQHHQAPAGATPSVIGSGWTSILMLPNAAMGAPPGQPGPAGQAALLAQLTQPVTFAGGSGRLLSTKLVTVLLTNDGRLFIGAVTPAVIEAAAAA
jgi:outer membrane lipoprotein-sorting protein